MEAVNIKTNNISSVWRFEGKGAQINYFKEHKAAVFLESNLVLPSKTRLCTPQ